MESAGNLSEVKSDSLPTGVRQIYYHTASIELFGTKLEHRRWACYMWITGDQGRSRDRRAY